MDLVDLIVEKRFLGQEFLAWLWFKSEERGGSVEVPGRGDVLSAEDVRIGTGDAPEAVEAAEAAPAVAAKPKAKPTKKHATKGGRR
jgi:hypothetical protein